MNSSGPSSIKAPAPGVAAPNSMFSVDPTAALTAGNNVQVQLHTFSVMMLAIHLFQYQHLLFALFYYYMLKLFWVCA